MDEFYLNNKKYTKRLVAWADDVIKNKGWEKFDHLHIDRINKNFNYNTKSWIEDGIFILDHLLDLIDSSLYDCILSISLLDSNIVTVLKKINLSYINDEIDVDTPPSLYLYPIGEPNYEETIKESILLEELSIKLKKYVYFKENWEEDFGYIRTIFIKN